MPPTMIGRPIGRRAFLLASLSAWLSFSGRTSLMASARGRVAATNSVARRLPVRAPATYYVDNGGSDSNTGLAGFPWQTCAKVSGLTLVAGDQIVFTAGQTFTGPLTIANSGAEGNYICVGTGRLTPSTAGTTRTAQATPATITCPDGNNGINANDCEYVSFDNLAVTGSGVNTRTGASTSTGMGFSILSTQTTSQLSGVRVTACSVTGTKDGLFAYTRNPDHQGYADLQVWGCVVHACQRVGIIMHNFDSVFSSGSATQNSDIDIGNCHVYDLPGLPGGAGVGNCGEGITIRNCTGGTIEYNSVHDINAVGNQGPGGTQGLGSSVSDGLIFRYNEAYRIFAPLSIDGAGIDFETGASNCIAEYNYIHDCDGAGYLCGSTVAGAAAAGNIVRYNIFARNAINNGAELSGFGSSSDTCSTMFYNNTIYASHGDCYNNAVGYGVKNVDVLYNNILISRATGHCVQGTVATSGLQGNLYYALGGRAIAIKPNGSTYTSMSALRRAGYESAEGSNGISANPLLRSPASGAGKGFLPSEVVAAVTYFEPALASPAKNAGVDLSAPPYSFTMTRDFHGLSTANYARNIGAVIPTALAVRLPVRLADE